MKERKEKVQENSGLQKYFKISKDEDGEDFWEYKGGYWEEREEREYRPCGGKSQHQCDQSQRDSRHPDTSRSPHIQVPQRGVDTPLPALWRCGVCELLRREHVWWVGDKVHRRLWRSVEAVQLEILPA